MNNINNSSQSIRQNPTITAKTMSKKENGKKTVKKCSNSIKDSVDINNSQDEKQHDSVRVGDSTNDGATVGANVADHLNESPMLEKLNALIAGVLVTSGIKQIWSGIKNKDRDKILKGSKQTFWGAYHGLNAFETIFKVALSLTPGLRSIGGFINADLGLTALYKDYKDDKKFNKDKVILHTGATAWGLRHLSLGFEGLAKSKWLTGLTKGSDLAKSVLTKAPLLGAVGAVMGVAGGALDAALGVRSLAKGIKTGNREKKILGALDIGIGCAMGAACLLTGPIGIATVTAGGIGVAYRTWRTDKKRIKEYYKDGKNQVRKFKDRVKDGFKRLFGIKTTNESKETKTELV